MGMYLILGVVEPVHQVEGLVAGVVRGVPPDPRVHLGSWSKLKMWTSSKIYLHFFPRYLLVCHEHDVHDGDPGVEEEGGVVGPRPHERVHLDNFDFSFYLRRTYEPAG